MKGSYFEELRYKRCLRYVILLLFPTLFHYCLYVVLILSENCIQETAMSIVMREKENTFIHVSKLLTGGIDSGCITFHLILARFCYFYLGFSLTLRIF